MLYGLICSHLGHVEQIHTSTTIITEILMTDDNASDSGKYFDFTRIWMIQTKDKLTKVQRKLFPNRWNVNEITLLGVPIVKLL